MGIRARLAAVAAGLLVGVFVTVGPSAGALVHPDGDTPKGFWYGTDSSYMSVPGPAPYREPVIGGTYGGYLGMAGNWAVWQKCSGDQVVWSATDSHDAYVNYHAYGRGIGVGVYWFMAGPGVDPHYDGSTSEAYAWGEAQAAQTLAAMAHLSSPDTYPIVFADVELPGHAPGYTPADDNGWNAIYTSPCSGKVRKTYIAPSVDRADVNGFAAYLTAHSSYKAGIYSAPSAWRSIFGTGSSATVTSYYEWTYTANSASLSHHPVGWCLSGTSTCAQFFGGMTSANSHAVMWQWSGGGGTRNGYGDFDQIDRARTP
jgi:hypothetical protein